MPTMTGLAASNPRFSGFHEKSQADSDTFGVSAIMRYINRRFTYLLTYIRCTFWNRLVSFHRRCLSATYTFRRGVDILRSLSDYVPMHANKRMYCSVVDVCGEGRKGEWVGNIAQRSLKDIRYNSRSACEYRICGIRLSTLLATRARTRVVLVNARDIGIT